MPDGVNKQEKDCRSEGGNQCPMTKAGWHFRHHLASERESVGVISLDGRDVILAENPGAPFQALKPLDGDFSVVGLFMQEAEEWLRPHRPADAGMAAGNRLWIEWQYDAANSNIPAREYLDTVFEPAASYGMTAGCT